MRSALHYPNSICRRRDSFTSPSPSATPTPLTKISFPPFPTIGYVVIYQRWMMRDALKGGGVGQQNFLCVYVYSAIRFNETRPAKDSLSYSIYIYLYLFLSPDFIFCSTTYTYFCFAFESAVTCFFTSCLLLSKSRYLICCIFLFFIYIRVISYKSFPLEQKGEREDQNWRYTTPSLDFLESEKEFIGCACEKSFRIMILSSRCDSKSKFKIKIQKRKNL